MKIWFLLLICLTVSDANAQDCLYSEYFRLTTEAEKAFRRNDYKQASKNYKLAFAATDFPLGNDLAIALHVATKQKDKDWAETIAIQLAKGGIPLAYFSKQVKFEWYQKFVSDFNCYTEYHTLNFNAKLKKELLQLKKEDLEWNTTFHRWRTREIELTEKELLEGFANRLKNFEAMCKEYGFPSERVMGYYYSKKQITPYPTGLLLVHIYQGGVLLYKNDLDNLVCNGYITPGYADTLKNIRGFGDSTGVEQEVKARIKKFRSLKK